VCSSGPPTRTRTSRRKKQNGRTMPAHGTANSPVPVLGTPQLRAPTSPQTLAPSAFAAFSDSFRVFSVFSGPTLPNPTPFQRFQSKPSAIHTIPRLLHFVTVCYTYFSSPNFPAAFLFRPAKMSPPSIAARHACQASTTSDCSLPDPLTKIPSLAHTRGAISLRSQ